MSDHRSLGEDDDAGLVAQARRELPYGTRAFEALLRRHEAFAAGTCRRYLGSPAEAEDAAQDVYVRVWRALPRFEGRSSFRSWLFSVVRNVCLTRLRRRSELEGRREGLWAEVRAEARRGFAEEVARTGQALDREARVNEAPAED